MTSLLKGAKRVASILINKNKDIINPATEDGNLETIEQRIIQNRIKYTDSELTIPYITPLNSGISDVGSWISTEDSNSNRYSTLEFLINSDYTTEVTVEQSNDGSTTVYSKKYRNLFHNTFRVPIMAKYIRITLENVSNYDQTSIYFDAYFSNAEVIVHHDKIFKIEFNYTILNTTAQTPSSTTIPTGAYPTSPQASYTHDYAHKAEMIFDKNNEVITKNLKVYDDSASVFYDTPNGMLRWYFRALRAVLSVSSTDTVDRTVYYKIVANDGDGDSYSVTGSFTATAGVTTDGYVFLRIFKLLDDIDTYDIYLYADDGSLLSFDSYTLSGGMGGGNSTGTYYVCNLVHTINSSNIKFSSGVTGIDGATSYTAMFGYSRNGKNTGANSNSTSATTYSYPYFSDFNNQWLIYSKNGTANNGLLVMAAVVLEAKICGEALILTED